MTTKEAWEDITSYFDGIREEIAMDLASSGSTCDDDGDYDEFDTECNKGVYPRCPRCGEEMCLDLGNGICGCYCGHTIIV